MAALGKIRSKGVFLIIIIGLGLFGFIAGDMFRSCESTNRAASNRAAVIFGDKIDRQEYAEYVERYVKVKKMFNNQADEESLRDEAWAFYKQYKLIEHECDEIGLTVTEQEFADFMSKGESPMLQPLVNFGFADNATGKFSFQAYKDFMKNVNRTPKNQEEAAQLEQMRQYYDMFLFYEKEVLQKQLLMQKYTTLVQACILSNPYENQLAYDAVSTESDVKVAFIDYSTINDDSVQCNDSELKDKYNQLKKNFYVPNETRAVEVFFLRKTPTDADRTNLNNKLKNIAEVLKTTENTDSVVRKNKGKSYGVYVSNKAFNSYPQMKAKLDSLPVGGVAGPVIDVDYEGRQFYSVVKVLGKASKPDSIEYRGIALVGGRNVEAGKMNTTADSLVNAIKNGGDFDALAQKYGQESQSQFMTTLPYERYDGITEETKNFFQLLDEMAPNEVRTFTTQDGSIQVIQVLSKRANTPMYDVAVVREELECSEETINKNDATFNKFLADNRTEADLKKNADKYGIQRMDLAQVDTEMNGISPDGRNLIPHSDDVLRWVFSAEKDDISNVFSCGQNNEILMAVVLTGINEKGYQTLENPSVRNLITSLVKRDKKAEIIKGKLNNVKSVDDAKAKNANAIVIDSEHVTLGVPISNLPGGNEPALNGAIAKTQAGKFSSQPVVGNNGVYVFEVKNKNAITLDEQRKKQIDQSVLQGNLMYLNFNDIINNAEIEDNRNIHQN